MRPTLAIAFATTLVSCAARVDAPDALFTAAPSSPLRVGPGSGQALLADVDRDGHLDLLVRHLLQKRVTVWRGDGKGGMAPAAASPLQLDFMPGAMALGDFDGDGVLDLCIAHKDEQHEMVELLRGDGRGGFRRAAGAPVITSAAFALYKPSLLLADVDEDGKLDVATANGRRNTIEILRGDGRGGLALAPGVTLAPGQDFRSLALGDVDGDGHLDLVSVRRLGADDEPGSMLTLRGDGHGAFRELPGSARSVPSAPSLEALADVNGDGRLDAVLSHAHHPLLSILWNDGHGGFTPAPGSPLAIGREAFHVVVADVDGDRAQDLVVATVDGEATRFESQVEILLGGARAFECCPGSPFCAARGAYDLAVGDLDEDGRPDVATSSFESDAITLLLGRRPSWNRAPAPPLRTARPH